MAKTKTGFEYTLPEKLDDDFEYLELIREAQNSPLAVVDVAKKLLGDEGYAKLKEHCTVDGRVSTEKIVSEITEISNNTDEIKK